MGSARKSLFGQVVVALIVGIAVGTLFPGGGVSLKPLGDGFPSSSAC